MERNFLSVDWDYFIKVHNEKSNSYRETQQDILAKWYNEWIAGMEKGEPLEQHYELTSFYDKFLEETVSKLRFNEKADLVLTESHGKGYELVKASDCHTVYHLDAHSDLGYGGLEALNYEVNCANWLGMLLKHQIIQKAYIIYSPYTKEHPKEFEEIAYRYPVEFITLEALLQKEVVFEQIHICRSGPWTPPWYDQQLYGLVKAFKLPITDEIGGKRSWHPKHLSLAERIDFKLGIVS